MTYALDEIRQKIAPIAIKYQLPAVYLFGSYARGSANADSDLDFLVDTTGTALRSLLSLGALYAELEETFGKKINLITVSSLQQRAQMESEAQFCANILKERVSVYAAA